MTSTHDIDRPPAWTALESLAGTMSEPHHHLRHLLADPRRHQDYALTGGGLFLDISRQRITDTIREHLWRLADQRAALSRFQSMMAGDTVNRTEKRAAFHTACRHEKGAAVPPGSSEMIAALSDMRQACRTFCESVDQGRITGAAGNAFDTVVVVGIGGSYLGTEFVATALSHLADRGRSLHFLANVDGDNFGTIAARIRPETTLWVVISKSYTTAETLANYTHVERYLESHGLSPATHVVSVTSKGSPGDDPSRPVLASFNMFDFIGGRYSVTSAVGALPLGLFIGPERFDAFLAGAAQMDAHSATAPPESNLPLTAALISVWNTSFLGYSTHCLIPYADGLKRLPAHVQQLNMESNGKSVAIDGQPLENPTGPFIFGEPGTNAQHSFFQLLHQGRPAPVEFVGVLQPGFDSDAIRHRGVTNHQELWANLLAQSEAFALGRDHDDPARRCEGNRPSSILVMPSLAPADVGRLLAFYEAKTVFEAFIWGINPFDQFGVELGKTLAGDIRDRLAARSESGKHIEDPTDRLAPYLAMLDSGHVPAAIDQTPDLRSKDSAP